jgi:hypothetical protein
MPVIGRAPNLLIALYVEPANRPPPGTAIVTGKGLAGEGTEEFFASPGLDLTLIRPARKDEPPRYFPNWLRQRVEAIIWTLKNQLGLERHGGRAPAGLWARLLRHAICPHNRSGPAEATHPRGHGHRQRTRPAQGQAA